VVTAAGLVGQLGLVVATSWEDLRVGGRLIIRKITDEIDRSDLVVVETTSLNSNVLFELGYSIGKEKRVWLIRDPSEESASRKWDQFALLRPIGFVPYANADDIRVGFLRDQPHQADETIYSDLIGSGLHPSAGNAILYVKSLHETEASRKLTRRVDSEGDRQYRVAIADASESSIQPLSWYAQSIYDAASVLVHFESPTRVGADIHNARCALIGGMAFGMGRRLLMLAEYDYSPPVDYQDLLVVYRTAAECVAAADKWLGDVRRTYPAPSLAPVPQPRLETELASIRLGAYVAENEEDTLAEYFVETASYLEVLEPTTTVFVGRKGAGKTANLIRAAQALRSDARHLVVVVKPAGYEMGAVIRLLRGYAEQDTKGYLVESLWKFLLFTEIARAAVADIKSRPAGPIPRTPQWDLIQYYELHADILDTDFAVRLESAVDRVLAQPRAASIADTRAAISEALHDGVLRELRERLGRALSGKERVALLIDNLDKAWERTADLEELSRFLLGLITSARPVAAELAKGDKWRQPVRTSMAVFLRSDIYARVSASAREPDKLPVSRLAWDDRETLARVVEDRYCATRQTPATGAELWSRFFCPTVLGMPTRERILDRVLPRPRDLVYLCSAAITNAVNRRHSRVEEKDVLDAEIMYSQFALEAIKVENGITLEVLEEVLFEFVGAPLALSDADVIQRIGRVVPDQERQSIVLEHLRSLSFLGRETREGKYSYADDPQDRARDEALARLLAANRGTPGSWAVHPAFRPYLEINGVA
jgi:hypothetical protein